MATPRLVSVKLLRNYGANVTHRSTRGVRRRFERPNGFLSIQEAAMLLGTYNNMIRRMVRSGRLEAVKRPGSRRIVLASVRLLLRESASTRLTAAKHGAST